MSDKETLQQDEEVLAVDDAVPAIVELVEETMKQVGGGNFNDIDCWF